MNGRVLRFDDSAHRAADAVLPWFVNGTLAEDELTVVEQHLRECPRCQREVDLLKRLQAFCTLDGPVPDAMPAYRRLRERIGGGQRLAALGHRLRALSRRWQRAPSWARWVIGAQFAGIVVLAVWVGAPAGESPGFYRTLGAPAPRVAAAGTIAVKFAPQVTLADLRRIVQTAGARVVDRPTASNAYVLQVPAGQRDAILAALRAEPDVVLVQPLAADPGR